MISPPCGRREPIALLVIDSVTPYLCRHSHSALCREVRALLDDGLVLSVALGLHRDLSSWSAIAALRSVCSAFLELRPSGPPPRLSSSASCRLELSRASGKVVVEILGMTVSNHVFSLAHTSKVGQDGHDDRGGGGGAETGASTANSLTSSTAPASAPHSTDGIPSVASAANTRPYTLSEAEQNSILEGGSSAGRIFYQPDDADDFDDEDPDDDLDI